MPKIRFICDNVSMSDLNTRVQMEGRLQSDLNVDENSSLFPPATIRNALDRAYRKSGGLFRWPMLRDAKMTSTQANIENYDYPDIWRPGSIYKLEVDGERWGEAPDGSPITFADYLLWKEDWPNRTSKKWANHVKQYFIFPVPTAVGTNNISVWGYKNVVAMAQDASTTIFSSAMPECNEAIVLEAKAILQGKGEAQDKGEFASVEAKSILAISFNKLMSEEAKYEKQQPQFNVPDFFPPRNQISTPVANFILPSGY